jgi:hypothetical protein
MDLGLFVFAVPFIWIATVFLVSILYRLRSGKQLFPRVPANATFSEAWTSGRSLKSVLSRIGGARNCLLVYIAGGTLTVTPIFPFNLMFLPEIFGLEFSVPVTKIGVQQLDGIFGKRLRISTEGSSREQIELSLRDPLGFQRAIAAKNNALGDSLGDVRPREHKTGWRFAFFRGFAIIWGLGVLAAMIGELKTDLQFRKDGKATTATMIGHTGQAGSKNDSGILQYFVAGRPYEIVSLQGSGIYTIGDTASVRYMPSNPALGREDGHLIFDIIFTVAGVCMLALGLTLGRLRRFFSQKMNA